MMISRRAAIATLASAGALAAIRPTVAATPAGPIVYPEQFGACGSDPVQTTAAMQAAIDAVSAAGGGVVQLSGRYPLTRAGVSPRMGIYGTVPYALWLNASHVALRGPGVLVPDASVGCTALLIGNGVEWVDDVSVEGIAFDASALSLAERQALGPMIGAWHIRRFSIKSNTLLNACGNEAAISGSSGCFDGVIEDNTVENATRTAINFDGGQDLRITGNRIIAPVVGGIKVQANLDNGIVSTGCVIEGNTITDGPASIFGVALSGCSDSLIANNVLRTAAQSGIAIQAYSTTRGRAEASRNSVTGNRITNTLGGRTCFGIKLTGSDGTTFDGLPLAVADTFVHGNYTQGWVRAVEIEQQALRTVVSGNHFADAHGAVVAVPSAIGTIISGNTGAN